MKGSPNLNIEKNITGKMFDAFLQFIITGSRRFPDR